MQPSDRRRRIGRRVAATAALSAALAAGFLLAGYGSGAFAPDPGSEPFAAHRGEVLFRIGRGSTADSVARRLEASGIIRDADRFLNQLRRTRSDARLQAGLYRFTDPLTGDQVRERLVGGDVATIRVTIPEGLDLREAAGRFSAAGVGTVEEVLAAFTDPALTGELIGDVDPDATDLEGYVFPSTYRLNVGATPESAAGVAVAQFRTTFDAGRRRRAGELGLSAREVATLASIVEKETGDRSEQPRIASVFFNRLERGMPLQSDPTVLFALKQAGRTDNNIRRADLRVESPYNTYRNGGIPPGPISSFGTRALDAVLHPEETDFLYFVSRNDGTHEFSRSLAEHNRAVRKWQVEYFRARRTGARTQQGS